MHSRRKTPEDGCVRRIGRIGLKSRRCYYRLFGPLHSVSSQRNCRKRGLLLHGQFGSPDVSVSYEEMGKEPLQQFAGAFDVFYGVVGGAGMVMGVSRVLKSQWPHTQVAVLEPGSSPKFSRGRT